MRGVFALDVLTIMSVHTAFIWTYVSAHINNHDVTESELYVIIPSS